MLSSWNEEEAELKLVDFGCSLILNEDAIDGKRYPSTPAYDPLEKITNKSAPNFKSDVWAAGCILYIILTGTHVSISYVMISICPTVYKLTVSGMQHRFSLLISIIPPLTMRSQLNSKVLDAERKTCQVLYLTNEQSVLVQV